MGVRKIGKSLVGGRREWYTIMQWMPVVVVAREQPWQSTGVYTVLLLAGGQHPAWVEMNVVHAVVLEAAVAETAKSQAAEARMKRMLRLLTVVFVGVVFL